MDLIGREPQRAELLAVLTQARAGHAALIGLRGAPGTGKTRLLDDLAAHADGFTILRVRGIHDEAEITFGSLFSLVRPELERVNKLAEPMRSTLLGALSLGPPAMADRLAIGAATLQLLAAIAEERPLLITIDDMQWIDAASRDALLFALRRLAADAVAAALAWRDDFAFDARDLTTIDLGGLDVNDAQALLRATGLTNDAVIDAVIKRLDANPLAMVEVAAQLSERQRLGFEPLHPRLPIGRASIDLFRQPIEALDPATHFALVCAALCPDPTVALVRDACAHAGFVIDDWSDAEAKRLVRLSADGVAFAHPLARSAVLELAPPSELRNARLALAAVLEPGELRTWHRALAALEPDETIAAEITDVAMSAFARGDTTAATHAAARGATLTPDPSKAAFRHLLAAQAASMAGVEHHEHARRARELGDVDVAAESLVLEAATAAWSGDSTTMGRILDDHLDWLAEQRPTAAAIVCGFAAATSWNRLDLEQARLLSTRGWRLAGEQIESPHPLGLMPAIAAATFGGLSLEHSSELLEKCRAAIDANGLVDLGMPVVLGLIIEGRLADGAELSERLLSVALQRGSVSGAAWLVIASAICACDRGDLLAADRLIDHGIALASASSPSALANAYAWASWLAAVRGDDAKCAAFATRVENLAEEFLIGPSQAMARFNRVLSHALSSNPEDALATAQAFPLPGEPILQYYTPIVGEIVELLVRLDRAENAQHYRSELDAMDTSRSATQRGRLARSRALLAADHDYAAFFQRAIELFSDNDQQLELARTRLLYGERLRRAHLRVEARTQLQRALAYFDAQGCVPWAERARRELRSAGAAVVGRRDSAALALTPQEGHVAHAVADGQSNREIAASLFISPKTVEMHLTRIYRKLGIRTRTDLATMVTRRELPT